MKIVGIDLGTSNSCMAVMRQMQANIIPPADDPTRRVTPTIVSYTGRGRPSVGAVAKQQSQTNPQFSFYGVKRLLGRQFEDPLVQAMLDLSPFDIAPGPNGEALLVGQDNKLLSPEEVLSEVLKKMKIDAEAYLGEPAGYCVLTVPQYYDTAQKQAAAKAAAMAGITVVTTLAEPSAAAIAYSLEKAVGRVVAVFDFGGGTFDVSILRVRKNGFDPLATGGDPFLGGEDFDNIIVSELLRRFLDKTGIEARTNRISLQRLHEAAELCKEKLSVETEWRILLQNLTDGDNIKVATLDETITRAELEDMTRGLVERTIEPCEIAMRQARISPGDIDDVVLVGGMTGMPLVRRTVEEIFGRPGRTDIEPDIAVAMGAALMGAAKQGAIKGITINERLSHSIGVADSEGKFLKLMPANTPLGRELPGKILTTLEDNQDAVWVELCEGERDMAALNRRLTRVILRGLEPAPAGIAQIRVAASVDRDGVCTFSVRDEANLTNEIVQRIHTASGLTSDELEELRKMDEAA